MRVRVELRHDLVRAYDDWDGELPLAGDLLTMSLPSKVTTPRGPITVTFRVVSRRFIRETAEDAPLMVLLDVVHS